MPKPRAKQLTPAEQEIVLKGGDAGKSSLADPSPEPIRKEPAATPAKASQPTSKRPAMIQTMARFTVEQMAEIEDAINRFEAREGVKISMNKWIVRACMSQVQRDK